MKNNDTIIAISTPYGRGGIGIVRVSGNSSLSIIKKIFIPVKGWDDLKPREIFTGFIIDPEKHIKIHKALVTYFKAPRSYTGEDVVEISCFSSPPILNYVLLLGIKSGARLAEPGEFTQRAFLNGKIDLLQAEAINDLIMSNTLKQALVSFTQSEGFLSKKIEAIKKKLIDIISSVEASIEFPDENLEINWDLYGLWIKQLIEDISKMLETFEYGKLLKEGFSLSITGKPNVGKSTLFNSLLKEERAIVTQFPGTTRDYIRETILINDIPCSLIDTAGIEKSNNAIDIESIKKGEEIIKKSDGILLIFDLSKRVSKKDYEIIDKVKNKNMIIVFNKMDLPRKLETEKIIKILDGRPSVEISAKLRANLNQLENLINNFFVSEIKESEFILNLRQKQVLEEVLKFLEKGFDFFENGYREEIIIEELKGAMNSLGKLTGEIKVEEIINNIFQNFCVGK
ncbi:MAG: tRNA uridine-5-carboxymethylaminomethyl(34) synthesis GTPase MnmE [Acidobacteriota bacterium]